MSLRNPCQLCDKSFTRLEHLRRHEKTHLRRAHHACSICPKKFHRRDVLRRHEATHIRRDGVPGVDEHAKRACLNCATAKVHCTKTAPCQHCQERSLQCSLVVSFDLNRHRVLPLPHRRLGSSTGREVPHDVTTGKELLLRFDADGRGGHLDLDDESMLGPPEDRQLASQARPNSVCNHGTDAERSIRRTSDSTDDYSIRPGERTGSLSSPPVPDANAAFALTHKVVESLSTEQEIYIDMSMYRTMQEKFSHLCDGTTSSAFRPFGSSTFPSSLQMNRLCQLYVDRFHDTLPFIHLPSLRGRRCHWLLVLAVASIGSQYINAIADQIFADSMQEFVRRCMFYLEEGPASEALPVDELAQIRLLHVIGAGYSHNANLFRSAIRTMSDLVSFTIASWCLEGSLHHDVTAHTHDSWQTWIKSEQTLRIGYCIWLLDGLWSFQHNRPRSFSLCDARQMPLPACHHAWEAERLEDWIKSLRSSEDYDNFGETLRNLHITQRTPQLDEFSTVLLLQGICRLAWEDTLSHRHDQQRVSIDTTHDWPGFMQAKPVCAKWDSSAIKCLDNLLAYNAPQLSTLADGTALSLHQSYFVLLSPMYEIVRLATFLASHSGGTPLSTSYREAAGDRLRIHTWATEHTSEARRAVVHACSVFWPIHKSSMPTFYEPTAIALASLVLWAFSAFTTHRLDLDSSAPVSAFHGETVAAGRYPDSGDRQRHKTCDVRDQIIQIDQPLEEAAMQLFVDHGPQLRVHMAGVGDFFASDAAPKLLRKAGSIIHDLPCWRSSTIGWIALLEKLEAVTTQLLMEAIF